MFEASVEFKPTLEREFEFYNLCSTKENTWKWKSGLGAKKRNKKIEILKQLVAAAVELAGRNCAAFFIW